VVKNIKEKAREVMSAVQRKIGFTITAHPFIHDGAKPVLHSAYAEAQREQGGWAMGHRTGSWWNRSRYDV
jgi:hypothetical protein